MNHVGDGTYFTDGVKHIDCLGGVWHTNSDTIAFFDADSFQGAGSAVNFLDELFISYVCTIVSDSDIVRPFATRFIHYIVE